MIQYDNKIFSLAHASANGAPVGDMCFRVGQIDHLLWSDYTGKTIGQTHLLGVIADISVTSVSYLR